jgi:hypothetical protein
MMMMMMKKWIFMKYHGRAWQAQDKDKWLALVSMVIKPSGSIILWEFVDWLRNYYPFKNNSAPLSYMLTHCGPETRILVFGVFSLQLWKTDDANLTFNTRVDFTHLITQYIKQQK